MSLKIVADENIVGLRDYFAPLGEVTAVRGREITPAMLRNADVLLVRSVTRVDESLLAGSAVKYVGSATSGVDHIDTRWLRERGIAFRAAPGANAGSVVEYVFCALAALAEGGRGHWREKSVGIIGGGHIGGGLARRLEKLGMAYCVHDPFLAPEAFAGKRASFAEALAQDVVTLHTPLTRSGPFPTFHMIDEGAIKSLGAEQVLINAARGEVVDNGALLARLRRGEGPRSVLDAWEGEPAISLALLEKVDLGTPHIAGYSLDGKRRGTAMIWRGLCEILGLAMGEPGGAAGGERVLHAPAFPGGDAADLVNRCLLAAYDIRGDHRRLLELRQAPEPAREFDRLRKHYPVRHEFHRFTINGLDDAAAERDLAALGFTLA